VVPAAQWWEGLLTGSISGVFWCPCQVLQVLAAAGSPRRHALLVVRRRPACVRAPTQLPLRLRPPRERESARVRAGVCVRSGVCVRASELVCGRACGRLRASVLAGRGCSDCAVARRTFATFLRCA
jgi:hypothetical protein